MLLYDYSISIQTENRSNNSNRVPQFLKAHSTNEPYWFHTNAHRYAYSYHLPCCLCLKDGFALHSVHIFGNATIQYTLCIVTHTTKYVVCQRCETDECRYYEVYHRRTEDVFERVCVCAILQ